ncbi:putative mannan polymerase II complex ANP1 subunit Anp1 [Aspergillus rambellii]|uniref:Putative mannan polymerase II complex ANP1 subunit Anp1 n=1 Tax=Aspergillus rambellii TaxID=308745 RepID=A0A0F8WUJ8_9EURO|nr:putative mannan polymerase II complex ANP1 subunit Anp1 [Aspergillus rambellii]
MGTPLVGTAIITGGNGSLGSEIAVAIAKTQPFVHLLLLARDIRSESVQNVRERIRLIGPRSIEVARVDLASFNSVASFAENTVERVHSKDIPPVTLLINCAAMSSYVTDQVTRDGHDPVYQTNCIAPFLLTVSLLEAFRAGDGTPNGGARVINIGCSSISKGSLGYFEDEDQASHVGRSGTPLSAKDALARVGSSKLIMSAAMYALRRSLVLTGNISLNIYTLDPGGMVGESHLVADVPLSIRMAHQTKSGLRPFLRVFSKSAINKVSVPAKVIAKVAFQSDTVENWGRERYYILDSEYEAGSVIPALRDPPQMEALLNKLMRQVEVGVKGMGSPESRISRNGEEKSWKKRYIGCKRAVVVLTGRIREVTMRSRGAKLKLTDGITLPGLPSPFVCDRRFAYKNFADDNDTTQQPLTHYAHWGPQRHHHAFANGYSAYPRGGQGGTFSISPHRFQPRPQPALRRRRQLFQRLCFIAGVSLFVLLLIFPSWRASILPVLSLGLLSSSPEDLHIQTVRYYDLVKMQGTASGWENGERVLMCTPLRDAASHLPMFFSHLRNLTYPHHLIDLAFLVSDSKDGTMEMLSQMLEELQHDPDRDMSFGEISVIQKDFGQKVNQDVESRHGFAAQAGRRKLMAQARNWLLSATLRPTHSWVYWRDADVLTAPSTIIEDLMRHDRDVIVPNVWRPLPDWLGGEQPYDLNSWQESETALALADTLDEDAVIVEGYAEYATWRPHLAYLRDPYGDPDMEMELDGVGGVSILAKAKVFRSGVHFPAFSFEKHAETEAFGKMARRMGFSVIGLPHYTIWHLYEPSVDDLRHMEEMEQERKQREEEERVQSERAERNKAMFQDPKIESEIDNAFVRDSMEEAAREQPARQVSTPQDPEDSSAAAGEPATAKGKADDVHEQQGNLAKNDEAAKSS